MDIKYMYIYPPGWKYTELNLANWLRMFIFAELNTCICNFYFWISTMYYAGYHYWKIIEQRNLNLPSGKQNWRLDLCQERQC